MSEVQQLELTEDEKKQLKQIMTNQDTDSFIEDCKKLSMLIRAIDGQSIDQTGVSEHLIDVTDVKERSRYPTYAILSLIVYLENIAKFNRNASACKKWSDTLSKALIGYKGLGRIEFGEQMKPHTAPSQTFSIGETKYQPESQPMKRAHFWSKAPKQEVSEFDE